MKNIKVIFFDLFNTLIYLSEENHTFKTVFIENGITDSTKLEKVKKIVLTKELVTYDDFIKEFELPNIPSAREIFNACTYHAKKAKKFTEVDMVLAKLRQKGFGICVISNISSIYKDAVFHCGLTNIFDEIIFSCEVGYRKPEEQIFNIACKKMLISPKEGLMIGDSLKSDYQGAQNAGMNTVLLNRKSRKIDVPSIFSLEDLLLFFS